jgi:calcium/calmodulin-dependent protein kinase I
LVLITQKHITGKEKMIKDEILNLSKMHHPNIIELKDLYETPKELYIVTDLANGGELFDRIVEKGSYTEKDASRTVKELIGAIEYFHGMGIVHRDLKPENLLLLNKTEGSPIIISDFGLSRSSPTDDFLKTTCGTPAYVAPEVLKRTGHGKPVDVWAMGVITYVLLCGYTPFWGETQTDLFDAILNNEYEFEEEYWGHVSDQAKEFIRYLLEADPHKRPTASEVMKHEWLKTEKSDVDLLGVVKKNMSARNRFRMAVHAVRLAGAVKKVGSKADLRSASENELDKVPVVMVVAGSKSGEGVEVGEKGVGAGSSSAGSGVESVTMVEAAGKVEVDVTAAPAAEIK